MLSLIPSADSTSGATTRRHWLKLSALAAATPLWAERVQAETEVERHPGTARRCISIFLCGGPSQPDLWDMKPDAPVGIRSVYQPIATSVPGIHFGPLIPNVARHADKLALIRSMTHSNNDHVGAIVHTLHGQLPRRPGDSYPAPDDHPGLGAILHRVLGGCAPLPAWVILPRPFTTYSPPYKGQSAGFLGGSYAPLMFNKPAIGSLSDAPLKLDALDLPEHVTGSRFDARRSLLDGLAAPGESKGSRRFDEDRSQALTLLSSDTVRRAFDLSRESDATRDRYGRNEYGQSFLMARRLAEAGVRMVNVFWTFFDAKGCQFNLWDNHGVPSDVCGIDGQLTGLQQLTHQYCTPSFDRSFSALLEDLSDRGMLDDTLVAVSGEFGRTPRINATSGRDHWAHCYTQLLAGGGVRGGQVYGASDAQGAYVKDLPVSPDDFAATILHAFGLPPDVAVPDPTQRPVRISTGTPVTALF